MENLIGKVFNQLTVLEVQKDKIVCLCDCGNTKIIKRYKVLKGETKSCGCLWRKTITKHGESNTPLYKIWRTMMGRCQEVQGKKYINYKGRGIKVCDRWHTFLNFKEDMSSSYSPGLTIERNDVNGNYEFNNCSWIPKADQNDNKRNTIIVESPWGFISVKQAAKLANISVATIKGRLIRKVPYSEMFVPLKSKGCIKKKSS